MNIIKIPFVRKVGIEKNDDGFLYLQFDESVYNHLQSIHASAQFTLAETASGEILQMEFPELVGKVVPMLRDSQIKFRKPALQSVIAYPSISDDSVQKFKELLLKKGRASISVNVEVKDNEGTTTCTGVFNWFVQYID
ncbi:YiiD C-terminal domain-containing protein [Mariprofundus ferrooxydans]|nr:YiiD C-terminal domain-containing protein [Mariprofundus ferrooxydans]